ncbi:MAG TPA: hypothetical protein VK589_13140, partial [Chryseolinea sp.]|nr:hypothetical protein [Chryseolinea sp.]
MNKRLQAILNLIQQSESLTPEEKKSLADAVKESDKEITITEFKLERTEKVKRTTGILLEETIAELEQKRKSVEAQNRELEIEASLERVRSRSMAMHKSDELQEVINTLFDRLKDLGIETSTASIAIYNGGSKDFEQWIQNADRNYSSRVITPFNVQSKIGKDLFYTMSSGKDLLSRRYSKDEKNEWFTYAFEHTDLKHIPDDRKRYVLESESYNLSVATIRHGSVCLARYSDKLFSDEENDILKRFARVFEQAYIRFLDLQKAEAQAREAHIEAALERVRARSMAMHKSEELGDLSFELVKQVQALGVATWHCAFNIYDENQESSTEWGSNSGGSYPIYKTPREGIFLRYYEIGKRGETLHVEEIGEDRCADHYAYLCTLPGVGDTLVKVRDSGIPFPKSQIDHVAYFKYGYLLFITFVPAPEAHDIFKRFAKVFEQTYTRFLDLKKAEAQARESQIEAALEKVRSRSLAMHKAEELGEVITVVFDKLKDLNFSVADGVALITFIEGSKDLNEWMANPGFSSATRFYLPYFEHPVLSNLWNAKNQGKEFLEGRYTAEENKSFLNHIFEYSDYRHTPQEIKDFCLAAGFYNNSIVFQKNTAIFINDYTGHSLSKHEIDILKRVSKVFEQTYTRFLDLQKAEEQAREAQIQLALERVRARTMAMQKSDELREVVATLYEQLSQLNFDSNACNIIIIDNKTNNQQYWVSGFMQKLYPESYNVPYFEHSYIDVQLQSWKQGEKYTVIEYSGKTKKEFDKQFFSQTEFKNIPQEVQEIIKTFESARLSTAFFTYGALQIIGPSSLSDENAEILQRFASVFDQTYTRFLDLQKAEAQAKEARIEAGLERVRSKAMSMQTSEELNALIGTVFTELTKLDLVLTRCVIMTYDHKTNDARWWMANSEAPEQPMNFHVQYHEHPPNLAYFSAWRERTVKWIYLLGGKEKKEWDDFLFGETELRLLPDFVIAGMKAPDRVYLNASFYNSGNLTLASLEPLSDEHFDILIRFAKVFDLTYTRFNDLKQAEAQAREAKIEAALERVRTRTMAMQRSEELVDVASILFQQVKALGVPQWNCGFNIWEIGDKQFTYYPGSPDGIILPTPCKIPLTEHPVFISFDDSRKRGDELFVYEKEGEFQAEHYRYMLSLQPGVGDLLQSMLDAGFQLPTFQIDHVANFSYGNLIFITYEHFPEMHDVFKRFAKVFEQTYTRFLDLQQAEAQAREAQIQLALERVRARTMAMQQSHELKDAASLLFLQVKELGIEAWTCGYNIWDEDKKAATAWLSRGVMQPPFKVPLTENETLMHFNEAAQRGESLFVEEVSGDTLIELYRYLGTLLVSGGVSDEIRKPGYAPPTFQV